MYTVVVRPCRSGAAAAAAAAAGTGGGAAAQSRRRAHGVSGAYIPSDPVLFIGTDGGIAYIPEPVLHNGRVGIVNNPGLSQLAHSHLSNRIAGERSSTLDSRTVS